MPYDIYDVSIATDNRVHVRVQAASFEEAKKKALLEYQFSEITKYPLPDPITEVEVISFQAVNAINSKDEMIDF